MIKQYEWMKMTNGVGSKLAVPSFTLANQSENRRMLKSWPSMTSLWNLMAVRCEHSWSYMGQHGWFWRPRADEINRATWRRWNLTAPPPKKIESLYHFFAPKYAVAPTLQQEQLFFAENKEYMPVGIVVLSVDMRSFTVCVQIFSVIMLQHWWFKNRLKLEVCY